MSELKFSVPLSVLAPIVRCNLGEWGWNCSVTGCSSGDCGGVQKAEAAAGAIEHLADVHGIHLAGEVEWGVRYSSLHFDPPQEFVEGPDERSAAEEFLRDCRSDLNMIRGAHLVQRSVSEWEEVPDE